MRRNIRGRCCGFVIAITGAFLLSSSMALGAGFEVGENTPRSLARGGTGVVSTQSPAAIYFNPALLTHATGNQLLLSANALQLNVEFLRDDFYRGSAQEPTHVFEPATNEHGFFPLPFAAASFDVGPEDLTVGLGVYGPPAYGNPCYGQVEDGDCRPERIGAGRAMVVETDMIVAYLAAGAGYSISLGDQRQLDVGLTLAAAYQTSDFAVVVESDPEISPPWRENPDHEAFVRGQDLSGWAPTGILGIAYTDGPLRLGASYRPPMRWQLTGWTEVEFAEFLDSQDATLTDDTFHLETWHAGSLRLGWGLHGGQHRADPALPRWDLAVDVVWENWSLVDYFRMEIDGDIEVQALPGLPPYELHPMYLRKGFQDTLSVRTGLSYGVNSWMTAHGGGFLETAAQPVSYTSASFISWERYAGSLGATFFLPADLQLDLAYSLIASPSRRVTNGEVYNPIPLSSCRGPDYESDACENRGSPPGNPQNEGQWSSYVQIVGAGLTWQY